jgi:hypothetical protein
MSDKTFIEIVEITKKQSPSKFKEGELYWQTNITDGKTGRKATVFGDWGKDWKLGDTVEVAWEKGEPYKGQEQWKLKDPNAAPKKPWTGGESRGGGSSAPMIVHAWMIAATLMPYFYPGDKPKKLVDVEELAKAILPKLQTAAPVAPAEAAAPAVAAAPVAPVAPVKPAVVAAAPVQNTAPVVQDEEFDEDDDKPF